MEQTSKPQQRWGGTPCRTSGFASGETLGRSGIHFRSCCLIPGAPTKPRFVGHCSMAIITAALANN